MSDHDDLAGILGTRETPTLEFKRAGHRTDPGGAGTQRQSARRVPDR
ncbi:hypothetical protein AB0O69_04410 [Streptomyces xiamenensis]